MPLIVSVSGIRGTIGEVPGEGLTPPDVVRYVSAFGRWLQNISDLHRLEVVVGRDARPSGVPISGLATATLQSLGIDVTDIELTTTPTVGLTVVAESAGGGIMISASHNPAQWNGLKFFNGIGEFLTPGEGEVMLEMANDQKAVYCSALESGVCRKDDAAIRRHVEKILALSLIDLEAIRRAGFRIAVDAVNSTGGIAVPLLLESIGVKDVVKVNCIPDGLFTHDPEPLPANLTDLAGTVVKTRAQLGIAVDPDVDRLALVCENGQMFGEEYTLVAVADYVLRHRKGCTVSNLSSTMALRDITLKAGQRYFASPVGEAHVVALMKEKNAVIGGEGNGGIIFPELHYGRDALVGIALFLSHLAKSGITCSALRATYPRYYISKNKITLPEGLHSEELLKEIRQKYSSYPVNTGDGVRIDFNREWVQLRKSNTEPVIRIYAESTSPEGADALAMKIMKEIKLLFSTP